jgi:hypothetical protein
MLGIVITPQRLQQWSEKPKKILKLNPNSLKLSILGLNSVVKHSAIVEQSLGYMLRNSSGDLPDLAIKSFIDSLVSCPTVRSLRNLACEYQKISSSHKMKQRHKYISILFKLALTLQSDDTHTLFQFAKYLSDSGRRIKAEYFVLQSLIADPNHDLAIQLYLDILKDSKTKEYEETLDLVQRHES